MIELLKLIQDFFINLRSGILPALGNWNYLLLAVFVALEGPIATLLGAAAASSGLLQPKLVFLCASLGNLSADALWYSLGYLGKVDWLLHYGRWLGLRREHLDRLERAMRRHAAKILLVAKLTAGFIIPSLVAAGLARVPWRRWFPVIAVGEMLWTGTLVLIGYYTTAAIYSIAHDLQYLIVAASIVFLLVIIALIHRVVKPDIDSGEDNGDDLQRG
jgi:membrane protein DedA with SNARE-associated domain